MCLVFEGSKKHRRKQYYVQKSELQLGTSPSTSLGYKESRLVFFIKPCLLWDNRSNALHRNLISNLPMRFSHNTWLPPTLRNRRHRLPIQSSAVNLSKLKQMRKYQKSSILDTKLKLNRDSSQFSLINSIIIN